MVDSIKNSNGKIIITTKPKAKPATGKPTDGGFEKVMKDRLEGDQPVRSAGVRPPEAAQATLDPQGVARMQRVEEITRQVRDGTYKLVDPAVLAERIMGAAFDKTTRATFLKKLLTEERETRQTTGKSSLSRLELQQLVLKIKNAADEGFDDPELDAMLAELG